MSLLASESAIAEGSRSLFPSSTSGARAAANLGGGTYVGVVNGSQFVYVYAKAGEYIELGSSNVGGTATATRNDIFVYNPQSFGTKGNETIPGTIDFKCSSQSGKGRILTRAAELAGPNSANGTGTVTNGYAPCYYVAPSTGIYGVRFLPASGTASGSYNLLGTVGTLTGSVEAWDVTVRATAADVNDINGRVFTYAWAANTSNNGSAYQIQSNLYYVSVDGYRYRQTLRGIDPNAGVFYANASGFLDSNGAPLYHDYRGNNQNVAATTLMTNAGITAQTAQYPLFFNDISPSGSNAAEVNAVLSALAIPQTPPSPQMTNVSFTGNVGGNTSTYSSGGTYTFSTVNTQTYQIVIRRGAVAAGADPNFPAGCVNDFDPANICNRTLTGVATTGTHNISWDGKDNSGFSFPAGNYSYQIMGRNGEIHFPMLDIEGNVNGGPTLQKLNGSADSTVYFDDRGYKSANGTAVGTLNGNLCGGAAIWASVPSPDHSLLGIDSVANPTYRTWGGTNNANSDCNAASQYFGDAKGLDIWGFEKTAVFVNPIVIVPLPVKVDVGTSASVTSSVIAGGTAYGNFSFFDAGANTATGVTYSAKLGNPAVPATCPAAVTFTLLPAGVTATYNPAPACTITFTGLPTSLTGGQSLNFGFNYVVAATNPGPIPLTTTIAATNENCTTSCSANTATAQTVVAKPIIAVVKSASPAAGSSVAVGSTITYTLSVTIDAAPLTSTFTLTDALGTGLTFGSVTNAGSFNCSGSLTCTLPSGTATGTYSVTYTATVNSAASGSVANNVTPSGGGGSSPPTCSPCSISHTVMLPSLGVTKTSNGPWQIGQAGATYTLTVTNTGTAATSGTITVKDTLPTGITAAASFSSGTWTCTTSAQTVTCTSTTSLAATNGSSTITIPVTVGAAATGNVTNKASVGGGGDPNNGGNPPTPGSCTAGDAHCGSTTTTVVAPPNIVKAFAASNIPLGGTTTLTFTITNPSANTVALTGVSFTDTLPAGMVVATPNGLNNLCGGTATAATGGTSVSLSGATIAAGAFCTLTVNVVGTTAGAKNNSVTVDSTNGGTGNTATATTTVFAPPAIAKAFSPSTIVLNGTTTMTFTITNSNATPLHGVSVTDTFPAGMTVAATPGVINTCAGTVTATAGTGTVTLSSGTIPANGSCALSVNVTGTTAGAKVNTTGTVTSTEGGPGNSGTGTLTVNTPANLTLAKSGPATPVKLNTPFNYTILLGNSGGTPSGTSATVSEALPPGMTASSVTPGAGVSAVNCGALPSAPGATLTCAVTLSAALPANAPNGTAQFTLNVSATAYGIATNYASVDPTGGSSPPTPGSGCAPATSCGSANTTIIGPPTITKTFAPASIPLNGTSTLTFVIGNPNTTQSLSGVSFTDTFPAGMKVAATPNASNTCGGTYAPAAGAGSVGISNATLAANASCTIKVDVTGTTAGTLSNTTGNITATESGTGGVASADLKVVAPPAISKAFGASSITVNGSTSLTFTISNPNAATALTGVGATDTLPPGMVVATPNGLAGSCGGGTITATAGSGSVSLSGATLAAGGSCTFSVNVIGTTVGSKVNTTGAVTSTEGGTGNTATATLTVNGQPKLGIAKTSNGPWQVGQTGATYTLTVSNGGFVATSGTVTVKDTLPAGITAPPSFNSGAWICMTVGQAVACSTVTSIAVGGSSPITIPVSVGAAAVPSVTNNASVGGGGDPNGGPPTPGFCAPGDTRCASTTTPVSPVADIAVTKTVDNAAPSVGNTVTFTITATNNGPSDATGVAVTDSLPAGLTFVSATPSQGSFNQTSGVWSIGSLANGASATLTISATVNKPGTITNVATVTASDQTDPNISNNSAGVSLNPPAAGSADIQVRKTVSNATPNVGDTIAYTIVVKNAGPDNATGVQVTDALPAGLNFVSAAPSQGSYNSVSGVWNIGSIANGGSVTLTLTATVNGSGTIVNVAKKTAEDQSDPDPTNDSSGVTINGASADIQVVKSVNNTAPVVGDNVTFTIAVRNNGPDDATNVQVTDALPAGLDFVSATPAQGTYASATGLWNIGSLPKNATVTLTIVATVTQSGGLTNTATKTGEDQTDPVTTNDSSSVDLGAVPKADLSITKTDGVTTLVPGSPVTYTITVSNAGPSDAIGANVVDTLPVALSGATWTCSASSGSSCGTASGSGNINDVANVLSGGTLTYTVTATVSASATGTLSNTATVTAPAGTIDPTPGNNSATDTDTLTPQADLAITKTDGVNSLVPGTNVTYTITASNAGPSNVTGATVADTLPIALVNPTWTCVGAGGGTCTASGSGNINDTVNLPVGASVTYTVSATVNAAATGTLSNTATVAAPAGVTDPTPANNSATDTDTLTPQADLAITKTDGVTNVRPGDTLTYTIVASNAGPSGVTAATVTDTMPAELTNVAWTCAGTSGGICTASGSGNINDTAVKLPAGASVTYTVTATVISSAISSAANTATIASGIPDPNPNNNSATDTDTVVYPVLGVTKTSNGPWTVGQSSPAPTYTLTIRNLGTAATAGTITVLDALPTGITAPASFTSGSWTCTTSGQNVTCQSPAVIGITPPGDTATITIPVAVGPAAVGTVTNNASVGGGGDPTHGGGPPVPGSCVDVHCGSTTTDITPPVVTVAKTSNPASGAAVAANQTITYTLTATVANAPLSANLLLTDTLTGAQTFGAVTSAGAYASDTSAAPTLKFTLPAGTAPGTYAVSYTATVNANATGSIGNGVVPTGGGPNDPTCTSCTTTHSLKPAVTVSKSSNPASGANVSAGDTITYTVQVVVANAPLANLLTLTDTPSANQTLGTVTNGPFTCSGTLVCTLPAGTAIGTYTLTYQMTVNANASGNVTNALVPSGGDNPNCTGSCGTTHTLNPPLISVAKASNPASGQTVTAGQTITYTLTATITQAALTSPLVLTDTLSTNQTYVGVGAINDGFTAGGSGSVRTFTLPTGTVPGVYHVDYTATVNNSASGSVGNTVVPSGGSSTPPNCTACSTTHTLSDPAIHIVKSSNPVDGATVAPSQTITFTLTATVTNAALTSNLVLTDTLGTGLTFGSVTAPGSYTPDTSAAPTLKFTLPTGTVPGTYAVSYTATVNANATGNVKNAVVATGGTPTDPVCDTCTTTHPLAANVSIAKALTAESGAVNGVAEPGENLTYTITLTNTGGVDATGYNLSDAIPANTTFVSASDSGAVVGGNVNWTNLTVPKQVGATPGTKTLTVVVKVANTIPAGITSIANVAYKTGSTPPTCPGSDPACVVTPTVGGVTIAKALTAESGTVAGVAEPGENLTYTITLTNTGGSDVTGYALSDALPANTTFVSATDGGTLTAGVINWTGLTVPKQVGATPGAKTVTVIVKVATPIPAGVTSIANVAYKTGSMPPTCPGSDPACVTTPTVGGVTIAKALTAESGTVAGVAEPGENLTYTITLTNTGGADVTGYGLSDALPANTTFVSASDSGALAAGIINWTGLTVPKQVGTTAGTKTVTVVVKVASPIPAGVTSIANVAYKTGSTPPTCPGSDPACVTTPTSGSVTIAKALTAESGTVAGVAEPGENLTYTITLTNTGGSDVTGYNLTDAIPANTTFVSASDSGTQVGALVNWTGLTVPKQVGTTAGTKTVTVTFKVASPIPSGVTAIANIAYHTGSTPPACPDPACVTTPTAGGVTIAKALTAESGAVAGIAEPGENLTYTITLTNTGGSDVTGYNLSDALPANTTFVSASDGGAVSAGVINWTGLAIPKQVGATAGTKTVTVVVKVASPIPAGVTSIANVAYKTGSTPPVCPGNDPACVVTPTASNLSVTKALSGESITTDGIAQPGEELTYTITVRNEGGSATTGTIVNETVPAHTTFVGPIGNWSCAANAPAATACDALVNVPAQVGATPGIATVTFTVKVDDPLPDNVTSILNAVALNDGTPPDCVAMPTAPGCVVLTTVNVRMTKTVASVVPTGAATYQVNYNIDVVNVGASPATYTLTDTLGFPNSGVVFIGNGQVATTGGTLNPALSGGQFTPANGTIEQLSANGVNLAVGATHAYTVSVRVGVQPDSLQDGACTGAAGHGFYNEASLAGTLSLDSAACAPVDGNVPLIRLVKTVSLAQDANGNHYGDVGDVLGYQFVISNPGTLPLSAVQLFDPRLESLTCDVLTADGVQFRVIPGDEIFFGPFNAPPNGTLDPGDSVACSGNYTLTADDVARRRVVNSATATGNAPGGQAVSSVSTAIFTQFR